MREIAYEGGGSLSRFAADVEMHCGGAPALFASLRLASSIGYAAVDVQPVDQLTYTDQAVYATSPAQPVTVTNTGVPRPCQPPSPGPTPATSS